MKTDARVDGGSKEVRGLNLKVEDRGACWDLGPVMRHLFVSNTEAKLSIFFHQGTLKGLEHIQPKRSLAMVATHAQQPSSSTSTAPKKNRRKLGKKTSKNADADQDMPDAQPVLGAGDDDELMIDVDPATIPQPTAAPTFEPLPANADRTILKSETRRIPIPPHRMTPLKKDWVLIFGPLTEILGLQVRMNVQRRCVEARVSLVRFSIEYSFISTTDVKTYKGYRRDTERRRLYQSLRARI